MKPILQSPPQQALPIRALQVILFALSAGLVLFAVVAAFMRSLDERVSGTAEIAQLLAYVAVGLILPSLAMAYWLRSQALKKVVASKEEALALIRQDRVPVALSTATIAAAAVAEAPGLLAIVTYLLQAPPHVLAVPVLSAGVILMMLPSRERLEDALRG
ncbi:MAG: hypothetical protein JNL28_09315 [Planctomycetes bacterium]|nr:hypothetical protein [Planctomycetota bacterium]